MAGPIKRKRRLQKAANEAAQEAKDLWGNVLLPGQVVNPEWEQLSNRASEIDAQIEQLRQQRKDKGGLYPGSGGINDQINALKQEKAALESKMETTDRAIQTNDHHIKQLDLSTEEITQDLLWAQDPETLQMQKDVFENIDNILDIYDQGGYTAQEQAQIRLAQRQVAEYEQAQRAAVEENMAARGQASGGAGIAAKLQAQQSGADRAAMSGDRIAIAGQQRALQALQAGTQMEMAQANKLADQANAINQFNTQYRQGVQARNVARKNTMETDEATRASRNAQMDFQNQMALTGAQSGAGMGFANFAAGQAQQILNNLMGGIGMGMDVMGKAMDSQSGGGKR